MLSKWEKGQWLLVDESYRLFVVLVLFGVVSLSEDALPPPDGRVGWLVIHCKIRGNRRAIRPAYFGALAPHSVAAPDQELCRGKKTGPRARFDFRDWGRVCEAIMLNADSLLQ